MTKEYICGPSTLHLPGIPGPVNPGDRFSYEFTPEIEQLHIASGSAALAVDEAIEGPFATATAAEGVSLPEGTQVALVDPAQIELGTVTVEKIDETAAESKEDAS